MAAPQDRSIRDHQLLPPPQLYYGIKQRPSFDMHIESCELPTLLPLVPPTTFGVIWVEITMDRWVLEIV